MDLIIFFAGFLVGFIAGETLLAYKLRKFLNKVDIKVGEKVSSNNKPQIYTLLIEVEKDIFYLWDKDKNEFLCQAKNIDELAKLALEYKNIQYAAVLFGSEYYMFVNGNVKKKDES